MCNDPPAGLSRRQFLGGTVATLAAPALLRHRASRPLPSPRRLPLLHKTRPQDASGNSAYSMAMHVHSSFSEFSGSMDCQLYQAQANGVDVLWWTDHDGRMLGLDYRDQVHFTSLTDEVPAAGQGGPWKWTARSSGPLASSAGGIVTNPCSPNDPVAGGALHVAAKSSVTGTPAKHGYNATAPDYVYRCTLQGQEISIDVLLTPGWTTGYLELLIGSSYHQASAGRPAGFYSLSYQIRPKSKASPSAAANAGTVPLSVPADGNWHTVTIEPETDIAALWPDMDYRDFGLFDITLNAVSEGAKVAGYFDYMRFDRTISGEVAFQAQTAMMAPLAARYPTVAQQQGLELSMTAGRVHCNWFGPDPQILSYGVLTQPEWNAFLQEQAIPQIHAGGGVASYNHPYGVGDKPGLSQAQMDAELRAAALGLLGNRALGADLLEVGYPKRGGVDLAHHAGLWDVMSRNAVFLTASGVNDDHIGENWYGDQNNWATSTWAASSAQADLIAALAAGQAWCGSLSEFALPSGAYLDLVADGTCPMGSVSLSALPSRVLTVTAAGIPAGGSVQVLQGTVDYAGTADPAPGTSVVASYTDAEMAAGGGTVTVPVDTRAECFARTQVLDSAGTVVALSNPVWLLQNTPPNGIPAPRQVS